MDDVLETNYDETGKRLMTIHANNQVKLWTQKGCEDSTWVSIRSIHTSHAPRNLLTATFCPSTISASIIATAGLDGLATVIDLRFSDTENEVEKENCTLLRDASGSLTCTTFSSEGILATFGEEHLLRLYSSLCASRSGKSGVSRKWALLTVVSIFNVHGNNVTFAPGGSVCLVGGEVIVRKGLFEWEWQATSRIENVTDEDEQVTCAHWGNAGFIAIGTNIGNISIWKMDDDMATRIATLDTRSSSSIQKVQWDVAGSILASVDEDGVVSVWGRKHHGWERGDALKVREV